MTSKNRGVSVASSSPDRKYDYNWLRSITDYPTDAFGNTVKPEPLEAEKSTAPQISYSPRATLKDLGIGFG